MHAATDATDASQHARTPPPPRTRPRPDATLSVKGIHTRYRDAMACRAEHATATPDSPEWHCRTRWGLHRRSLALGGGRRRRRGNRDGALRAPRSGGDLRHEGAEDDGEAGDHEGVLPAMGLRDVEADRLPGLGRHGALRSAFGAGIRSQDWRQRPGGCDSDLPPVPRSVTMSVLALVTSPPNPGASMPAAIDPGRWSTSRRWAGLA